MRKKLLLLGGSRYLAPVIEAAHSLGLYVITCDYLPDNDAHKLSDEYCNISIIEKDAVLEFAQEKKIDGIMSFACDPGVITAAYVAEKMGLPFQGSYKATYILQDKGLFREFLLENNFNCPHAKRYTDKNAPYADVDYFNWPVIVKPVDSAGSKGVTKVDFLDELEEAINIAVEGSHNGAFIIEDFLTFQGYHSSADFFTVNGKLQFISYSDQLFDKEAENPYTPAFIIWPSSMKQNHQDILTKEIQRLMILLGMKTGIYNIESCVGSDGKPYIMEVSPRGGGCKIAELQRMAYGIDLIENEVRKAVGFPVVDVGQTECDGFWCEMIVHARPGEHGILKSVWVDSDIEEKYLKVVDMSSKPGDLVRPFTGANMSLGDMFFRFSSREELDKVMSNSDKWLHIEITKQV
ncbi:MAG: acetyl-CoA carboxylase biotin carboxylase subunit family protein [Acetatifactor sp.]